MKLTKRMPLALLAVGIQLFSVSAVADGCFVFRWDKKTDINEPNQKAIILYHAGREDLLLQVKYEGAVDEFGWLIPVPSLPTVERGSMEAFYELSQLTQRGFSAALGGFGMKGSEAADTDGPSRVKVIQTKTVGAYQVSILAANDAAALETWLKENGYSIPGGKREREVVDDYIRRGWFFVAAKIDLNGGTEFKLVPAKAQNPPASAETRRSVQHKLASGELHPLFISFDSAKCVFPLKISSVAGKPSEVSLYVLSEKPLLNQLMFDEATQKLEKERAAWETQKPDRTSNALRSIENMRVMQLRSLLNSEGIAARSSLEELQATVRESAPRPPDPSLDDDFFGGGTELLLDCMLVKPDQIAKTARTLPRLKNNSWFLAKFTRTFSAAEMRDLEFDPAIPALTETLPRLSGRSAAFILAHLGTDGASALIATCRSSDAIARENAVRGLGWVKDTRFVAPILPLLHDTTPAVRFHAVRFAAIHWDAKFVEPIIALLHDSNPEIRAEASECLLAHEGRAETAKYAAMANDADPNVQICALAVLVKLNPEAIPREPLLKLLKHANPDVQNAALHILWKANRNDLASRGDLLPLLNSERLENIQIALNLIEKSSRSRPEPERNTARSLTVAEAVPLVTNRFAEARLTGLSVLQQSADPKAIELTLPLLRDPNPIVRNCAFIAMKTMAGETLSETDPAKWEIWWKTNHSSLEKFSPTQSKLSKGTSP
jgi:HEAT repeat protein